MKLLILVISATDSGGIYDRFYKAQNESWNVEIVDGVETYYIYGGGEKCVIEDKNIFTGLEEILHPLPGDYYKSPLTAGPKTIKALEMINNIGLEYDYVFRTNLSSYIDKRMLHEYLSDKPREKYYSGFIGHIDKNIFGQVVDLIEYASGSGIVLSKDLVDILLKNKNKMDNDSLIDDVAVGQLLNKNGIYPYFLNRIDILDTDASNYNFDYFFYRLKSKNRDLDIKNMYEIYKNKK